jgi:ABC-type anion transport system duplicated permease subunit
MMSMAGGWFFLMINEAFVLGDATFVCRVSAPT